MVAVVEIFESSTPGMMDAHWVVSGEWPIDERPFRATPHLGTQLLERLRFSPQAQYVVLKSEVRWSRSHILEHSMPLP